MKAREQNLVFYLVFLTRLHPDFSDHRQEFCFDFLKQEAGFVRSPGDGEAG